MMRHLKLYNVADPAKRVPGWLANLLLFGLLIVIVLVAFFWQMSRISNSLQRNAMDRSRMVAGIIEENLQTATLTNSAIDEIVTIFLHDKASFIEYLDGVEPLQQTELAALAPETGLLGISLIRPPNRVISGAANWLLPAVDCSLPDGKLFYRQQQQLGYLVHHANNEEQDLSCVLVGLDAARILSLRKKTSLPVLLNSLSSLPGINFIHLDKMKTDDTADEITLVYQDKTMIAVTRMQTGLGMLEVGLDAHYFLQRRNAIRNQFIFFGSVLLILGIFFSWLLYRNQQRDLERATTFERELAREHEAATLGRATATIAHEVRNPLNAINMGLQRLQIESDNLEQEQKDMLVAMREAVSRTSTIVTELQRFTRKLQPKREPVQLDWLVNQAITLYRPACEQQGISVTGLDDAATQSIQPVSGDREMLAELVENLVKNSVEAQPDGGIIQIQIREEKGQQQLSISNKGFELTGDDRHRPGEPYFTSKTRGNGLGLALCKRIAEAHDGELEIITEAESKTFTVRVTVPLSQ